jgi:hypothetical protein
MRTKTLLMTAAALAAGIISSQAQGTVYSQNVVGYVNVSVPGSTLQMVANQLDTGSNTLDNVFSGTGLLSTKTTLLQWNGVGYNQYTYLNCADSPSSPGIAGWYNGALTEIGTSTYLQPAQGVFMHNLSASTITVPTVGQVVQGTNIYSVPVGLNVYSVPQPLAGTPLDAANVNFPVVSTKVTYLSWNGVGFNQYTYLNCADSPTTPGQAGFWNGALTVDEDTNPAAWPAAGGSFFVHNLTSGTLTWTNVFEVQ